MNELAMRVNGVAPSVMAEEAKRLGAIFIHYSTDYVFDGERAIEAVGDHYLILRSSWIYSARGSNFVLTALRLAREKLELAMVDDQAGSPTWARALAKATAELLRQKELITRHSGVYHLAASGHTSRYEFTKSIIDIMKEVSGIPNGWASVKPIGSSAYPLPAKRPRNPVVSNDKIERAYGIKMPLWRDQARTSLRELAVELGALAGIPGTMQHCSS